MKVLVVGSGGREHALVWKIGQSPLVETVYCAPGNAGIAVHGECVSIGVNAFDSLVAFAREQAIGLTVIGPEDPLARGIVDRFQAEQLPIFGPSAAAARLEASKQFAKDIMTRYHIPTAASALFSDADEALDYVRQKGAPIVIKADGLAAGKGVTVARNLAEAEHAIREAMVERVFGEAGMQVIIEECLVGEEASILAFSDGKTVLPMASSQDHKPAFDGDAGPNTGGMGAYSPAPLVTESLFEEIVRTILQPCIDGMAEAGAPYTGVLYAGLMMTAEGPKVIEFNCRFGDPETQVVLPRMKSDIVPVMLACCEGTLENDTLEWSEEACVSVVMASGGYPGPYPRGLPITGLEEAQRDGRSIVFHAGTTLRDGQIVTHGGRVLNVTSMGETIPVAIERAYAAVRSIHFEGAHFRSDIGRKALDHGRH